MKPDDFVMPWDPWAFGGWTTVVEKRRLPGGRIELRFPDDEDSVILGPGQRVDLAYVNDGEALRESEPTVTQWRRARQELSDLMAHLREVSCA